MLKIFLFISCIFNLSVINAQRDSSKQEYLSGDRPGAMWYYTGLRPEPSPKDRKYDRLLFDITYNDWVGDLDPFKNKWSSLGLNSNLMFDIPINKDNTVSFGTGITHSFQIISHFNKFKIDSTNSFTQYQLIYSMEDMSRRSLRAHSFSIPLELRFKSKGWRHFKIHIGGKVGYQTVLLVKTVTQGVNGRLVQKENLFPDVYRLVYGAHVRVGIRNWAVFASYNFNPIFSNKQSIQLNFIQMGLSFSLF